MDHPRNLIAIGKKMHEKEYFFKSIVGMIIKEKD
jgi:hypothetical protein